ncbi:hypothetical protein ACG3SL_11860 [Sphingomonas sp. CJ20]
MPASLDTCAPRRAAGFEPVADVCDADHRAPAHAAELEDADRWGSVRTRLPVARKSTTPTSLSPQQTGWKPRAHWSPIVVAAFDDPYGHVLRMVRYGHVDLLGWSVPLTFVSRRKHRAGAQEAGASPAMTGATLPEPASLSGVLGGLMLAHRRDVPQLTRSAAPPSQGRRDRRERAGPSRWVARTSVQLPVGGGYAPEAQLWRGAPATARAGGIRYGHIGLGQQR